MERAWKNTDEIKDASVNLETREANIIYNKNEITYDQICETIVDTGFEVEE